MQRSGARYFVHTEESNANKLRKTETIYASFAIEPLMLDIATKIGRNPK
jgi:hypothetical protein